MLFHILNAGGGDSFNKFLLTQFVFIVFNKKIRQILNKKNHYGSANCTGTAEDREGGNLWIRYCSVQLDRGGTGSIMNNVQFDRVSTGSSTVQ